MAEPIERRLFVGMMVAALLVGVVAITSVRNVQGAMQASDWVNHTHGLIMEAESVVSAMRLGDEALMRYLLTADERDQAAYREGYGQMLEHLEVTLALLKSDPPSAVVGPELERWVRRRVELAEDLGAMSAETSPAERKQRLLAVEQVEAPRQVREIVTRLKERQISLLQERDQAAYRQGQTTRWTVYTAVVLLVGLLGASYWLVRDDVAARRRVTETLRGMNEELERRVGERTRELAAANEALVVENLERTWSNQTLEHQLRYSQLIINTIAEPILVVTLTLNVVRANAVVPACTGLVEKRIIGNPVGQLLRGPAEAEGGEGTGEGRAGEQEGTGLGGGLAPMVAAMRQGRELHRMPARLRGSDGGWQPVRVSVYPVRDADRVVGAVLTVNLEDSGEKAHFDH